MQKTDKWLSRYGIEAQNLPFTPGKVFFVFNSDDTAYQDFRAVHDGDQGGEERVFTSINDAYDAAVSNRNDIIVLNCHGGHAVNTAGLVITKNRVHFMGLDIQGGRHYGSTARITGAATVTEVGIVHNTGVGNTFRNLKFDSGSTVEASIYAVAEGGEYSLYENCEFYKSTDLDVTGSAELLLNGDSAKFKDCTFGSLVNAISGAIIRPCVTLTSGLISGKACRDSMFENCLFWRNAGNVANRFVYSGGAASPERMLLFKDCVFLAARLSTATPAEVIGGAASLTDGQILLANCSAFNVTKWSTLTGVLGSMPTADVSMDTVGVQAA